MVMSKADARCLSLARERLKEVVEQGESAGEPVVVAGVRAYDTGDHLSDARRFGALRPAPAEVDVVDDGRQSLQAGVAQAGRGQDDLERAAASLVRVIAAGHVEADLVGAAGRPTAGHEAEAR